MIQIIKRKMYKWVNDNLLDGCSDYNSVEVRRKCRSKKQAREMFEKLGAPYANGTTFFLPFKALSFVKKHGFPVVIKPNMGGYSRGSYFPITTYRELYRAMILSKVWWPVSIIESYLEGKNYRVVVTKGRIEVVNERYAPFVIGDGNKTIRELMEEENTTRIEMKLLPIIHLMEENHQTKSHLQKQGFTFDSVPKMDERVILFHRISLAPGGSFTNLDISVVTPKNKELCLRILDSFDANVFGIDVIMEQGIDVDFDKQKTIFLELNSRPYMKMHAYPRYGEKPDMTECYKRLNSIEVAGKGTY